MTTKAELVDDYQELIAELTVEATEATSCSEPIRALYIYIRLCAAQGALLAIKDLETS